MVLADEQPQTLFSFVVDGPPVSVQTRNRMRLEAWRARVRSAAAAVWPADTPPFQDEVSLKIAYYFDGQARHQKVDVQKIAREPYDQLPCERSIHFSAKLH